jgi:hypothetical protein
MPGGGVSLYGAGLAALWAVEVPGAGRVPRPCLRTTRNGPTRGLL